jgi:hypothetical protein
LIVLPSNKRLGEHVNTILISMDGDRSHAIPATLISRAVLGDSFAQGESYFFEVDEEKLRTDMKVSVWVPSLTEEQAGVTLPKSAFIWYFDKVYVYVKVAANKFSRRSINAMSPDEQGYFVANAVNTGEEIVVAGAQLLLSEELREQIPDED